MEHDLHGKRIAFLATDGVEQVELEEPWRAVEQAGGEPVLVSIHDGTIHGVHGTRDGDDFPVDELASDARSEDFDGLVIPGGVHNPDALRQDTGAVAFVRSFAEDGKPIGAICHGPWLLVEAGLASGHDLTSYPSLHTDIENAGGHWVDREVVVDDHLVTSRSPRDLPAFCGALLSELDVDIEAELDQASADSATLRG